MMTKKNVKTVEKCGNMLGRKEKGKTSSTNNRTRGFYQKVLVKRGRLKRYRDGIKQYRQNRICQNNKRKFYPQVWEECTKYSKTG